MPCACKKKGKLLILLGEAGTTDGNPDAWGPAVWSILHVLVNHVGNSSIDIDQIREIEVLIHSLPGILPCSDCAAHMRSYLVTSPFQCGKLLGPELNIYVQKWLMDFHNTVRTRKSQSIDITTLTQIQELYGTETIESCQITTLMAHVTYGIRNGIVRADAWKKWVIHFNRLRVMTGLM